MLDPLSKKELPEVVIVPQSKNLGFAGGNNVGIATALELECDYIFLHNQDGYVAEKTLEKMVSAAEVSPWFGALQSVILLHQDQEKINSAGNNFHFLGFGYCDNYKESYTALTPVNNERVTEVGYASGAALLLRASLVRKYGLLDEDFFMYHEDLEYSLRLKIAGFKAGVVNDSLFYHQYEFSRNPEKWYLMERNRYAVLLLYYRWRTLVLALPAGFVTEFGILFLAAKKGWLKEKAQVYWYWLKPTSWKFWLKKRAQIQRLRRVPDHELLRTAVGRISFDDPLVSNVLLTSVGNPILSWYWKILKKMLVW
jgi:GT2 family glycosyltransferase